MRGQSATSRPRTTARASSATTHYRARVEPGAADDLVQQHLGQAPLPDNGMDVDVWLDDAGRVIKVVEKFAWQGQAVTASVEYWDYGMREPVTLPPDAEISDC